MGNSQSHEADAERPDGGRKRDRHHHRHHESTSQHPPQQPQPARHAHDPQATHPMQVPDGGRGAAGRGRGASDIEPSGPPAPGTDYAPLSSNLHFPPRLPLPIQEEVYTPGSPIITPADLSGPHSGSIDAGAAAGATAGSMDEAVLHADEEVDGGAALPHQASLLSNNTTVESDEEEDQLDVPEEHKGRTVPTVIEWRQPGKIVYITGTFNTWSKKTRLHRDPKTHILTATLHLQPGTHHVKFIVDGVMHLSPDLPQAVDYTNVLLNYVEVSADDIPKEAPPPPATARKPTAYGLHPPLVVPPGTETNDFAAAARAPDATGSAPIAPTAKEEPQDAPTTISTRDTHYGTAVPDYLVDLDRDEKTNRFQRAAQAVADIPTPPSLPLFLSKSILNGTMPVRDDASVLNMPNHTVLNHLATSSIKNDVLATSLTTRYKRKYVTTIIYRPTNSLD